MTFDPLKDPDHYVMVSSPELRATANWGFHAWVICRPGVIQDQNGESTREPIKLRGCGYGPLAFENETDAKNFTAALNHGQHMRSSDEK
jgi:hypothetical protein